MLVKHNLLLNGDKLKMPRAGISTDDVKFIDGKIYFNNITAYIVNFIDQEIVENIDDSSNYFVGVYGNLNGDVQFHKKDAYRVPETNNHLYYVKVEGRSLTTSPLHVRGYEGRPNSGVIQALFVFKDSPSDVDLPNIKSLDKDIQAYYPPEGNYKEIEPMRG